MNIHPLKLQFRFYLVSTQVIETYNGAPYKSGDILITKFKSGLDYIVRASSYANAITLVSHRIYTENSNWLKGNPNGILAVEFPIVDTGEPNHPMRHACGYTDCNPSEGFEHPKLAIQQVEEWGRQWIRYIDQEDIKVSESINGFPLKKNWNP